MKKMYGVIAVAVLIIFGVYIFETGNNSESKINTTVEDNSTDDEANQQPQVESIKEISQVSTVQSDTVINSEFEVYSDSFVTFSYPKTLKSVDSIGYNDFLYNGKSLKDTQNQIPIVTKGVYLISDDAKVSMKEGDTYTNLQQGRILSVQVQENWSERPRTITEQITEIKSGNGKFDGTYELIRIDGQEAVLASGGGHGLYYISASIVKNNKHYTFSITSPNTKVSEWDYIKAFLETVKIK